MWIANLLATLTVFCVGMYSLYRIIVGDYDCTSSAVHSFLCAIQPWVLLGCLAILVIALILYRKSGSGN